jgi:hypothetical protein
MKRIIIIIIILVGCLLLCSISIAEPPENPFDDPYEYIEYLQGLLEQKNNTIQNLTEKINIQNNTIQNLTQTVVEMNQTIKYLNESLVQNITVNEFLLQENINLSTYVEELEKNITFAYDSILKKNELLIIKNNTIENLTYDRDECYFAYENISGTINYYQNYNSRLMNAFESMSNPWSMGYIHPETYEKTRYFNLASFFIGIIPVCLVFGIYFHKTGKIDNVFLNALFSKMTPDIKKYKTRNKENKIEKELSRYEKEYLSKINQKNNYGQEISNYNQAKNFIESKNKHMGGD